MLDASNGLMEAGSHVATTLLVNRMSKKKLCLIAGDAFLGTGGVDKSTLINCLGHFAIFSGPILEVRRLDGHESWSGQDPYLRCIFFQLLQCLLQVFSSVQYLIVKEAALTVVDIIHLDHCVSGSRFTIELVQSLLLPGYPPSVICPDAIYCKKQVFVRNNERSVSDELRRLTDSERLQYAGEELDRQRYSERLRYTLECRP